LLQSCNNFASSILHLFGFQGFYSNNIRQLNAKHDFGKLVAIEEGEIRNEPSPSKKETNPSPGVGFFYLSIDELVKSPQSVIPDLIRNP
jgi:hypothetical protein